MALQVEVPCHDEPLLLVHLLTAGEPGTEDRHIATLPLLVLPEAACDEVGCWRFPGGGGALLAGSSHGLESRPCTACHCDHSGKCGRHTVCRSVTCGTP